MWGCRFISFVRHVFFNGVASNGKFLIVLLKWAPPAFLIKYSTLVVGDLV